MKLSASSDYPNDTAITIDFIPPESEDLETGLTEIALHIARLIIEVTHHYCTNVPQAEVFSDLICKRTTDMVQHYMSTTFKEVADLREESQLYKWMEEMFNNWLSENLSESEFKNLFKDVPATDFSLKPSVDINQDLATIHFDGKSVRTLLLAFPLSSIDDSEQSVRHCDVAYLIGIVAGDILFGEDDNPIRKMPTSECTDGGLTNAIRKMREEEMKKKILKAFQ